MLIQLNRHPQLKLLLIILILVILTLIWCEYMIYYATLWRGCRWPRMRAEDANQVDAMVLSDTHLLGTLRGHWFDKLRREWQMYRSFRTAISMFQPRVVFILGDIFDEGQWASDSDFRRYVHRFNALFEVPAQTKLYVVVGNHDIGFHYWITEWSNTRFESTMNVSSVDQINFPNDIHFIRLNSMAMEGDDCHLCADALSKIDKLGRHFEKIRSEANKSIYPILLTHFPLYRANEEACQELDSIPLEDKSVPHRSRIDTMSPEASEYLLSKLKPRLILNGHIHHGCVVKHNAHIGLVEEWTVSSFNWRNRAVPTFLLMQVTSHEHFISKCFLPNENTVIIIYELCLLFMFLLVLYHVFVKFKYKSD